jgi:aspartyl protease family protein
VNELPRTAKIATVWLLIITALWLVVQWVLWQREQSRFAAQGREVVLRRSADGHFHWPGTVNGVAVDFLVDTGATSTALPARLAEAAGLVEGLPITSSTAGGVVHGYQSRADISLRGGVRVERLRVAVLPRLEAPLLGMDLLGRLRFTQHDGELRIDTGTLATAD